MLAINSVAWVYLLLVCACEEMGEGLGAGGVSEGAVSSGGDSKGGAMGAVSGGSGIRRRYIRGSCNGVSYSMM